MQLWFINQMDGRFTHQRVGKLSGGNSIPHRADWRSTSGLRNVVYDGTQLDTQSGSRNRRLSRCDAFTKTGSVVCVFLNLALSLFEHITAMDVREGGVTVTRSLPATASTSTVERRYEARLRVRCQVCRKRQLTFATGWRLWAVRLWWKSVPQLDGVTSIIWQLEQRPIGEAAERAFGVWQGEGINSQRTSHQPIRTGGSLPVSSTYRTHGMVGPLPATSQNT